MPSSRASVPAQIEPPAPVKRGWRQHPYVKFALRAGIGAGLIAFFLWRYNPRPILDLFARERIGFFAATVVLYLLLQVVSSWRWRLVAGIVNVRGRFSEFIAYYFIGMFTNMFVPGLVGGDAARAIYLGRRHGRMSAAAASVICDRSCGLFALFIIAAAAAISMRSILPRAIFAAVAAVGACALLGFFAAPVIERLLRIIPGKIGDAIRSVSPYLSRPSALLPALVLSFGVQFSLAFGQYILALGLGLPIPFLLFLLCVPIGNAFASIPITFNGLGVREATYLLLFGAAGIRHEDAVALGLLWFAATLVAGLAGGSIAFLKTGAPATAPAMGQLPESTS
ncbi:MAG: lysylphosphatidylglycerol synthase transmembrane domain-containing protein [Candidatus Binataceae bacterium]